ncbi:MAG: TonB-dependent receptor domain-containing protein [Sphingomonadales bacterium]
MREDRWIKLRSTLLGGAALALVASPLTFGPALAQEGAEEGADIEEVTVTGSRIKRADLIAVSPVNVISNVDMVLSGNVNIERTLNELPAVNPSATTTTNNGGEGIATVDLRELGPERTLVLMNGRRLIGSNTANQVDLNTIPASLVERVEVLTGGASAVYGSDAVAGVVNFIMKDDFEGLEAGAQYNISERGDADVWTVDVTMGGNFADGRGNAVLSASYTERNALFQGDRDFASVSKADFGTGEFIEFGSSRLLGGRASGGEGVDVDGDGTLDTTLGFNPDGSVRNAAGESFNFAPFQFMQTPQKRYTLAGLAHYDITDDMTAYFELNYSSNQVDLALAPDANDIPDGAPLFVSADNPLITPATRAVLLAAFDTGMNGDVAAGDNIITIPDFRRRMADVGLRQEFREFDLYRFVVGLRGSLTDTWDYDVNFTTARVNRSFTLQNFTSDLRIQQALLTEFDADGNLVCQDQSGGCVPISIFGDGAISPEGAEFVSPDAGQTSFNQQYIVTGNLNGSIDSIDFGAGALGLAVGGEYRRESAAFLPDATSQTGELGPGNSFLVTQGKFDVYEGYAEALMPIIADKPGIERLDVELAARVSDYSTAGGVFSWAGGVQYQPVSDIRFRGGFQRAVRAPNISELFGGLSSGASSTTDPCDATRLATATDAQKAHCIAVGAPAGYEQLDPQALTTSGGNPDLFEETADTFTIGAVVTPEAIPGLTLTVDYYNIEVKDAISTLSSSTVLDICFASLDPNNQNCLNVTRDATGRLVQILSLTDNIASQKREGIDWALAYTFEFGPGQMTLQNIGSYNITNTFTSTPLVDPTDCSGIFGGGCTGLGDFIAPKWRLTQNVTYEYRDWAFRAQGRVIGPIDNADAVADPDGSFAQPQVDTNLYLDINFTYKVTENVLITGGVENLSDNSPPPLGFFNNVSAGTDPSLFDVVGRSYYLGARLNF